MTPMLRELVFRVMDGHPQALPTLHFLSQFKRYPSMLRWLIAHQYTGSNFLGLLRVKFDNSQLTLAQYILQNLDRENEKKPVLVGLDFFPK